MITNGHINSLYSSVRIGSIGFGAIHEEKETRLQKLGSGTAHWPRCLDQAGAHRAAAPLFIGPSSVVAECIPWQQHLVVQLLTQPAQTSTLPRKLR